MGVQSVWCLLNERELSALSDRIEEDARLGFRSDGSVGSRELQFSQDVQNNLAGLRSFNEGRSISVDQLVIFNIGNTNVTTLREFGGG